jgi:hypothetical protein
VIAMAGLELCCFRKKRLRQESRTGKPLGILIVEQEANGFFHRSLENGGLLISPALDKRNGSEYISVPCLIKRVV